MSVPFHILEWQGRDVFEYDGPGCFAVTGFGRDVAGKTTSVRFEHLPTFFIAPKRAHEHADADADRMLNRAWGALRDILDDHLHESSGVVRGKPFTGWRDDESPFLKLVFFTRSTMRRVGDLFRRAEMYKKFEDDCPDWFHRGRFAFDTYELDADPVLQALTALGVPPTGWVRVDASASAARQTTCEVHYDGVPIPLADDEVPEVCAPHVIATFDIEVFSSRSTWLDQIFPEASVPGDVVTQVCTFFSRFGESAPYEAESLVLIPPEGAIPERASVPSLVPVRLRYFDTEARLLSAWVRSYADHGVAVWCHFNGLGFDEAYLHARCERCGVDMSALSFARDHRAPRLVESKLESNAYGWNFFRTVELAGVFHLDVYQDIKRNHNLESYSLDSCAEHFVPSAGAKTGLKPQEQFDCFASKRAEDIERLTEYCCQDVALTYQLMERLAILPSMIETAAVSWVTPTYLVTRGQQVRVYSCIKREIYARGAAFFLRDTKGDPAVEGGYKGATVLEPKRAPWFYPRAIVSLDFASLYPSIMMQYNLSHESWTQTQENDPRFYKHEEGCGFVRASVHQGVLPAILIKLKKARKTYKNTMAFHEKRAHEAPDDATRRSHAFMEKVYDAKQKATKVTMNSVYGFCGVANNGKQPCLPLASAVTTIGRSLIDKTKAFCEAHVPDSEVIYGDSVASYTPVYVRTADGTFDICTVDRLAADHGVAASWVACADSDKEACEMVPGVDTWSDGGWTRLHRVIRHALAPHKTIVRVLTDTGLVDVTDDHSLLSASGQPLKPRDATPGTPLLHHPPPIGGTAPPTAVSEEKARVLGYFMGAGTCGVYDEDGTEKASWALNVDDRSATADHYLELCRRVYVSMEWAALRSPGACKIVPLSRSLGSLKRFIAHYQSLTYRDGARIVPRAVLNGTREVRVAFWDGLLDALDALDGKRTRGRVRVDLKHHLTQAHVTWLAQSLGYTVSLNAIPGKPLLTRLTMTTASRGGEHLTRVKKVFEIKHVAGTHVYDLTTDNAHFAAGVGNAIVHNTDSVMWNVWPEREVNAKTVSDAFVIAQETCDAIAPIFVHDGASFILLEFENVYVNYLLLKKKIYATLQYSADLGPDKPKKTVKKGLRCVRRDTIEHARRSQSACVEHITNNRIEEALEVGRLAVHSLFDGSVPFDHLVTSKKVSSSYKVIADTVRGEKVKVVVTPHGKWKTEIAPEVSGTCEVVPGAPWKMVDDLGRAFGELTLAQPHVHVMHRIEQRTPNGGPRVGDRVPYVFIHSPKGGDLQISKAEDPAWAEDHGLKPDACYYFDHALRSPLDAVLSVFVTEGTCDAALGWRVERAEARNKAEGQRSLSAFGFGVAASNAKPSRIARAPAKKAKTEPITAQHKGNIASFFGK